MSTNRAALPSANKKYISSRCDIIVPVSGLILRHTKLYCVIKCVNPSPLDKMAAISQTPFSYALIYVLISIKFHYSLFTMVQLTISNIPTSVQKIAWCRLDSVTPICAALGGDVLKWYIPVDYIAYNQFRTLKIANYSIVYMILYMAVQLSHTTWCQATSGKSKCEMLLFPSCFLNVFHMVVYLKSAQLHRQYLITNLWK